MRYISILLFSAISVCAQAQVYNQNNPLAHTYSIVARDSVTGEMGVGVQSHWFSVGTSVSWGEAGTGVVATQSFIDKSYGPKGLELLRQGFTAPQALEILLRQDEGREVRQVAICDNNGNIAAFTGKNCIPFAKDIQGNDFSVQSNMMLTDSVCENMAKAFKASTGKPLAERIILAMENAEKAGGDIRGKQSAALIIVRGNSMPAWNDKQIDIRVDDSDKPLEEINRLYKLHIAYQHMNSGDLATEKRNMELAMKEYNAAMKMFPENLEMQFWTAITLANNGKMNDATALLKIIFSKDANWKLLTLRLPAVGLLTVNDADMQKIKNL